MSRPQLARFAAAIWAAALGLTGSAMAAKASASPAVVQGLLDCRKLTDNGERLACYDKAAAAMENATTSGDLVALDRAQRRAARRQAFGFTLPSLSFLDRGEKAEDINTLTSTIAAVSEDPYGKLIIRLEDGAVWRQTEAQDLARRPRKGSTVTLKRGMLGGFFLIIDGQPAGKARRDS
jgi:hypothetical protein